MGTSGSSDGPTPHTPLVPSWLGDGGGTTPLDGNQGLPTEPQPLPPIPQEPPPDRFRVSRRNFSSFARSNGGNTRALRRAVRDYVRSGTRGSGNAAIRMGASRATARGMLSVFSAFSRDGVQTALTRFNLGNLAERPLEEVLIGFTDLICGDGGSIDEGIAREAWLETVAEVEGFGDLASISPDQMQDIFLAFISNSVVGRLLQDIGVNGFKFAVDLSGIEAFTSQLKSYIRGSVRDSFSGDLTTLATLTDQQIRTIVDQTYQEAWDLLVLQGDAEG